MVAPTDICSAQPGQATLEVQLVSGQSVVTSAFATSPLKLLTPRARGQSVWAFTSSFGGGLVAGDQTRLGLRLGTDARCFLGTQASTKIYRNPSLKPCSHVTDVALDAGSLLVLAPDPVQAFASSTYIQRQEFHLAPSASLVLLDWLSSGRAARGERWAFNRFQSRNEVWNTSASATGDRPSLPQGKRVFLDSLLLDSASGSLDSPHRTGRFNCFALLLFLGPLVRQIAVRLLNSISQEPVGRDTALVCSASPVCDGAMLRAAGETVETVRRELHHHLEPLCDLLGDDPWARKW